MSHANHITALETELEQAKKAATPVVIEVTERTKDRVVLEDRTHGTTRVDHLGGTAPQFVERPAIKEVVTLEKSVDPAVGKLLSQTDSQRVIELTGSGTIRTDLR